MLYGPLNIFKSERVYFLSKTVYFLDSSITVNLFETERQAEIFKDMNLFKAQRVKLGIFIGFL